MSVVLITNDSSIFYTDSSGVSDGGNGFSMSSPDMARIGLLYANKGMWQDKQNVSALDYQNLVGIIADGCN